MVKPFHYRPSVSSRAATIFRLVGQAILPAAAFQAALGCGYGALRGRMESWGRLTISLQDSILPHTHKSRLAP
jgi:hypothetical protein